MTLGMKEGATLRLFYSLCLPGPLIPVFTASIVSCQLHSFTFSAQREGKGKQKTKEHLLCVCPWVPPAPLLRGARHRVQPSEMASGDG